MTSMKTPGLDPEEKSAAFNASIDNMCRELRLSGFRERFAAARESVAWMQMSVEEQLHDLLRAEKIRREANAAKRLRRQSNLPMELAGADFSDLRMESGRKWDPRLMEIIRLGQWMTRDNPGDLVLSGPCGVGKSFIAACCANHMLERRKSVFFVRAGRLFTDLMLCRARELPSLEKRKAELCRVGLLILDDFLIEDMSESNCTDLLDIINSRSRLRPTIYTSQFRLEGWLARLGNTPMSQALIDRVAHSAYRLHIEGPSQRRLVGQ